MQSSSYSGEKLNSTICKSYFSTIQKLEWNNFDAYWNHFNSIHFIDFNELDWQKSRCSCAYWPKHFICKHVICLARATKSIPVGQK